MKKRYMWGLSLLFSIPTFAQPVINESFFPEVGKSFRGRSYSKTVPLPPIEEGANITWNMAGLDSLYLLDYEFSFRVRTVASTDSGSKFPGATSAYTSFFGSDSIENFQKVNGDDLEFLGYNLKGVAISERFSIPRVELRKNLGFGEFIVKESRSFQNTAGFAKHQRYRDTTSYAGYGTLITSFGTYQNVVLMKRLYTIDLSFTGPNGPYEFGFQGRDWLWYLPGYGIPYVTYSIETNVFVPDEIMYKGYVGFIPQVAVGKSHKKPTFELFPSVIEQGVSAVSVNGPELESNQVELKDALGRTIWQTQVRGQQFRIPELSPGVYPVVLKSGGSARYSKILVQ